MARTARNSDEQVRKARGPLGGGVQKLTVEQRPGFVRRWVNDDAGRLTMFENNDYEYVSEPTKVGSGIQDGNSDLGSRISTIVGKKEDGTPQRAYLMEIREDWYQEDQAQKAAKIDADERGIMSGRGNLNEIDAGKSYVPEGGISITSGRR